jgi:protein-tyrosine phosphatase
MMSDSSLDLPRAVPLQGASNLRDLGGYQMADGRRVRFGRLYRSATLAHLTPQDVETIAGLGLRTVCDLRGVAEAAQRPSRLPAGAERVALPIEPTVGASLRDLMLREMSTGEDVVDLLRRAYLDYVTGSLHRYRAMLELLLQPERQALLFHCSAGKDRTGVGAALILLALGASRETIIADYVATDRLWLKDFPMPEGAPKPLTDALYGTHPALLEQTLDAAIAPYGDAAVMLEQGLGLDGARLDRLRDLYLE